MTGNLKHSKNTAVNQTVVRPTRSAPASHLSRPRHRGRRPNRHIGSWLGSGVLATSPRGASATRCFGGSTWIADCLGIGNVDRPDSNCRQNVHAWSTPPLTA